MEVLEIHNYPQFLDKCSDLMNMEWPRSKTMRLRTLKMSCDNFPTSLILVQSYEVIGHSKITPIPSLPLGCFIESVLIHPEHRGKGLGKFLMAKTEEYAKRKGIETVYLSTKDKQGFYSKLGYIECEPVQIYGGPVLSRWNVDVPPCTQGIKTVHLSTEDKQGFDYKFRYTEREPVQIYGGSVLSRQNVDLLPPVPPPPPPPPPPNPSNSSTSVLRSTSTYMKKYI